MRQDIRINPIAVVFAIFMITALVLLVPILMSIAGNTNTEALKFELSQRGYTAIADQEGNFEVGGDLEVDGNITCGGSYYGDGSNLTGISGSGGSSVYVDGVLTNTPNFSDGGDINFTTSSSTVTASLNVGINATLTSATFTDYMKIVCTSTPSDISAEGEIAYYDDANDIIVGKGSYGIPLTKYARGAITKQLLEYDSAFNDVYPLDILSLDSDKASHPHAMVLEGSSLYTGCLTGTHQLVKVPTDFSSVEYVALDRQPISGSPSAGIWDMIVADSSLWAAGDGGFLYEIDLTDPTSHTCHEAWTVGHSMEAIVTQGDYLYCLGDDYARKFTLSSRTWTASAVSHPGKEFHAALLESTSSTIFATDILSGTLEALDLNLATTASVTVGHTVSDNIAAGPNGLIFLPLETSGSPVVFEALMSDLTVNDTIYTENDYQIVADSLYTSPYWGSGRVVFGTKSGLVLIGYRKYGVSDWLWLDYCGIVPTGTYTNVSGYGYIEEIQVDGTYTYMATFNGTPLGSELIRVGKNDMYYGS